MHDIILETVVKILQMMLWTMNSMYPWGSQYSPSNFYRSPLPPPLQSTMNKIVHTQLVSGPTRIHKYVKKQYVSLDICYLHSNTKIIDFYG